MNDGLPLKDHKKTNFGVKKIRPVWRHPTKRVGENKKRKDEYLYLRLLKVVVQMYPHLRGVVQTNHYQG